MKENEVILEGEYYNISMLPTIDKHQLYDSDKPLHTVFYNFVVSEVCNMNPYRKGDISLLVPGCYLFETETPAVHVLIDDTELVETPVMFKIEGCNTLTMVGFAIADCLHYLNENEQLLMDLDTIRITTLVIDGNNNVYFEKNDHFDVYKVYGCTPEEISTTLN